MKRPILILLAALLGLSCMACAQAPTANAAKLPASVVLSQDVAAEDMTVDRFLDDEQGYVLPGIAWGMSPEALDALPGYSLGEELSRNAYTDKQGRSREKAVYQSDALIRMEGNWGSIAYQFIDDRLIDTTISFKTNLERMKGNDLAELYDASTKRAEATFGKPSDAKDDHRVQGEIEGMNVGYTITSRTWVQTVGSNETRLHISKFPGREGVLSSVSISLSCVDPSMLADAQ